MKKRNFPLFFLVALIALFSCGKEDDPGGDNGTANYIKYDGVTYELSYGFLVYYGQYSGEGFSFNLYLVSDGIDFDAENWNFSGQGHGIFFELFSPTEERLEAGTYTYEAEETEDAFTFSWAAFMQELDLDDQTSTQINITGGSVVVALSGSTYTLTIDAVDINDKPITGNFIGILPRFNADDLGKSETP
ncbi:MAG: hypothetical protein RG741_05550 [Bacteroidales bacterium]|nr:hypothetical protein [Bacteroidales bacterium]